MEYIRDKRSPTPKNATVSHVMSRNRAKNSKPEMALRRALWSAGLRGYRLHRPVRTGNSSDRAPGSLSGSTRHSSPVTRHSVRPDISFVSRKLAIFVHGCFWHRCPNCNYKFPKTNRKFWKAKFARNVTRDQRKVEDLQSLGWTVLTFWECDLKTSLTSAIKQIGKALR